MDRPARWVIAGIGSALVLLPLGLSLPDLPMSLRADESSHYFLARSLVFDRDAVADELDVDRIYREMPHTGRERLALGTDDHWLTPRWAVSPLYALTLAPAVAAARTHGAYAFNALCFVLAFVLVARSLIERRAPASDASLAWLVAGAGLCLSAAFVFVGWIHPASLRLLLVSAAFSLGWRNRVDAATYSSLGTGLRMAVAGVSLGLCLAEVPWLAVLAPALLARHRRSLRRSGALLAGILTGAGAALFVSWLVLGHAGPGGFAERAVFEVESPDEMPWQQDDGTVAPWVVDGLQPVTGPRTTVQRLGLSLVDRRRGLLVLFPFAALFVARFAAQSLRRRRRAFPSRVDADKGDRTSRLVLAAGLAALVFSRPFAEASPLDLERYGDPLLAAAWPAFFFLLSSLPGVGSTLVMVAVSALLLTPALFTPFGPPVPHGNAHHAERGAVISRLPTDLREISQAAGWDVVDLGGPAEDSLRLWTPAHAATRHAEALALLGGERVELWLEARRPVTGVHLDIRSFAPNNRLTLNAAGERRNLDFAGHSPPDAARVRLDLGDAWRRVQRQDGGEVWIARAVATTRQGERPRWRTDIAETYYVGALLTVLGSDEHVARDVWHVRWGACGAPPSAAPDESLLVLARLRNISDEDWLATGSVRVRLAHRWRHDDGRIIESPVRTDFDGNVAAGQEALVWVAAQAPATSGTWQLEIEPVYELVGWFSNHLEAAEAMCHTEIVVTGP